MSKRIKENNGSIVEEDKERANGDSSSRVSSYALHRRSKSSSEKNFNPPTVGDSYFTRKDFHQSSDIVPCSSSCRASPLHKNFSIKDDISNQRASLEQDVRDFPDQCVTTTCYNSMGQSQQNLFEIEEFTNKVIGIKKE